MRQSAVRSTRCITHDFEMLNFVCSSYNGKFSQRSQRFVTALKHRTARAHPLSLANKNMVGSTPASHHEMNDLQPARTTGCTMQTYYGWAEVHRTVHGSKSFSDPDSFTRAGGPVGQKRRRPTASRVRGGASDKCRHRNEKGLCPTFGGLARMPTLPPK